jgi:hypothetical protein
MPDQWNLDELQGLQSLQRVVDKQAEFIAYLHDFRLMTVLMLMLLPLVFLIRNPEDLPQGGAKTAAREKAA